MLKFLLNSFHIHWDPCNIYSRTSGLGFAVASYVILRPLLGIERIEHLKILMFLELRRTPYLATENSDVS